MTSVLLKVMKPQCSSFIKNIIYTKVCDCAPTKARIVVTDDLSNYAKSAVVVHLYNYKRFYGEAVCTDADAHFDP